MNRARIQYLRRAIGRATFAAFGVALAAVEPALAEYPARPITLIVPYGAGGSNDALSRILAEHMAKTLGQPIIIENEAGAAGTTATARLTRVAADGYTIIMGNMGTHGAAPAQYANLKYNPATDFTPVALTAEVPAVIVVRKDFPANNLREFVNYVRKNQDKVSEAHAGVGSPTHTFCTLLQSLIDTKTARVAYRSGGQMMNDLVGGQVDFACANISGAISQIQAGTLKAIAVAGSERAEAIKDVPTTKEGGMPEFQVSAWNALFGPRNLPSDIQTKLNDAVVKALDDGPTRKRLLNIGFVIPDTEARAPEALQKLVESEVARWSSVMKAAGAIANGSGPSSLRH